MIDSSSENHPLGVKKSKFQTASRLFRIWRLKFNDPSLNPATEVNKLLKYPSASTKKFNGPNFLDSHVTISKPHMISALDLVIVSLALLPPLIISFMNQCSYSCYFNGHPASHYWEHEKCKTPSFDEREQAEIIVAEVKSIFDDPNQIFFTLSQSEISSKILHSRTRDPGK